MRASHHPDRAGSFSAPLPVELPDIDHLLDQRSARRAAFDASYGFALPDLLPHRLSDLAVHSRAG